jgi:hypothetical protein
MPSVFSVTGNDEMPRGEGDHQSIDALVQHLESRSRLDFILALPFAVSKSDLKSLVERSGLRAVLIDRGHQESAFSDAEVEFDVFNAIWHLPECDSREIVFVGPWWQISTQMIDEARTKGIRSLNHHSWGRWISSSLPGLLAMKIVRRIVRPAHGA